MKLGADCHRGEKGADHGAKPVPIALWRLRCTRAQIDFFVYLKPLEKFFVGFILYSDPGGLL